MARPSLQDNVSLGGSPPSFKKKSTLPEKPPTTWRTVVFWVLFLLLATTGLAGGMIWSFLSSGGEEPGREVDILITPGRSFQSVAHELEEQHVVSGAKLFIALAHFKERAGKLQVGRFRVHSGWTPGEVLAHLVSGKPLLERVTIPEGLPWWEVGERLEKAGLLRFEDFSEILRDSAFLAHWGIPFASAEGFLFPDTYLLMRPLELNKESAKKIVGRLIDTFWRRTASLWLGGQRPGPKGAEYVRNIVTLASIIEKETSVPAERERVAGVYANRLRIGMLLQADPTIIYGLGASFSGPIRRSQLNDTSNRYNTYKHAGLPPGPICSPGLASLHAAVFPEEHKFMYFVARGDGSHVFSETLKAHNSAVQMYRKLTRKGDNTSLIHGGVRTDPPVIEDVAP